MNGLRSYFCPRASQRAYLSTVMVGMTTESNVSGVVALIVGIDVLSAVVNVYEARPIPILNRVESQRQADFWRAALWFGGAFNGTAGVQQ